MLELIHELEDEFKRYSNREYADKCSAYMRNRFSFYGINSPTRKQIQKKFFPITNQLPAEKRWEFILECWAREEREWHYFAIDWLNSWNKKWHSPEDIFYIEKLLTQHSWWDSVDGIASNCLGKWIKLFPKDFTPVLKKWREMDNFWLHRSSLIFQLKYKNDVNTQLLEELIQQYKSNKEFFIQKAIGWTLRQLSKSDPMRVKEIISNQEIKGLALKEASKYLN